MDCSLPGSSVHGIFQARVLERGAIAFSVYVLDNSGFHSGSDGKESACNVGDLDLIPGLGRSPGEGHAWGIPKDRGAWWAIVHGVAKSQTSLSN